MKTRQSCSIFSASLGLVLSFFSMGPAFAVPKEIILIRHADKLAQVKPGPFLSPKGEVRAIAFAFYYLNKFPEPDYIIPTAPADSDKGSSMREIQTVAPLANILAKRHPQSGFTVLRHYKNPDEQRLAYDLLHDKKYDGKTILICWHHGKIPKLLKRLGAAHVPEKVADNNFDTVYVIKYNANAHTTEFNSLQQQYNVSFNGSWKELYNTMALP